MMGSLVKKWGTVAVIIAAIAAVILTSASFGGAAAAEGTYSAYDSAFAIADGSTDEPWEFGWMDGGVFTPGNYFDKGTYHEWAVGGTDGPGVRVYDAVAQGNWETWPKQISFTPQSFTLALKFTAPMSGFAEVRLSDTTTWMVNYSASDRTFAVYVNDVEVESSDIPNGWFDLLTAEFFSGGDKISLGNLSSGDEVIITLGADDWNFVTFNDVVIDIVKLTPVVTEWPTATGVAYGEPLSASELTGGSVEGDVEGHFEWALPGVVPTAENDGYPVWFVPDDAETYVNSATGTVAVAIEGYVPPITASSFSVVGEAKARANNYGYRPNGAVWTGGVMADGVFTPYNFVDMPDYGGFWAWGEGDGTGSGARFPSAGAYASNPPVFGFIEINIIDFGRPIAFRMEAPKSGQLSITFGSNTWFFMQDASHTISVLVNGNERASYTFTINDFDNNQTFGEIPLAYHRLWVGDVSTGDEIIFVAQGADDGWGQFAFSDIVANIVTPAPVVPPPQPPPPAPLFSETVTTETGAEISANAPAGVIAQGTSFVAEEIPAGDLDPKALENLGLLYDDAKFLKVLDLKLVDAQGNPVAFDGTVTVRVKLDADYAGEDVRVVYVDGDGNIFPVNSYIKDGYIVFEAEHFSYFALVSASQAEAAATSGSYSVVEEAKTRAENDGKMNGAVWTGGEMAGGAFTPYSFIEVPAYGYWAWSDGDGTANSIRFPSAGAYAANPMVFEFIEINFIDFGRTLALRMVAPISGPLSFTFGTNTWFFMQDSAHTISVLVNGSEAASFTFTIDDFDYNQTFGEIPIPDQKLIVGDVEAGDEIIITMRGADDGWGQFAFSDIVANIGEDATEEPGQPPEEVEENGGGTDSGGDEGSAGGNEANVGGNENNAGGEDGGAVTGPGESATDPATGGEDGSGGNAAGGGSDGGSVKTGDSFAPLAAAAAIMSCAALIPLLKRKRAE